ncbi:MAG: 23S rRNA (guanosine(2251)-2'-O)-methyltransferase RlmB [Candidatus Pelethousia sp.]|nr:23S rRNA (guanosine(2251)-2'-O)-methyltransferase RlmB [Candidatus Pelethousia sp.]
MAYDNKGGSSGKGRAPGKPFEKKPYGNKEGGERKPYNKSGGDRKPYNKSGHDERKPYDKGNGERKPYYKGDGTRKPYEGERKPYNRDGGERKPYDGERKPYNRDGGERKPYDGERKPYYKGDGERKPYYKGDGERKPYDSERKPYYKGDGERKPYYKGDGAHKPYEGERKPYNRDGGERKPYDGERKPYYKNAYNADWQDKPNRGNGEGDAAKGYKKGYPKPVREAEPEPAPQAAPLVDELPYLVMGRNAVKEALRSGRSIDRILVNKEQDGSLRELVGMARDRNVQLREMDKAKLDEMCMPFGHGNRPGNHQGIVAQVPGVEYCDISDILAVAKEKGEPPFIILLDGVEDPHNLGSILRSAECAGAHGVIIPKRRSAGVTAAVCKASAGAVEYIKVARVSNLVGAMERIKDECVWLFGADMTGKPMAGADMKGAVGLVIGGEGSGLSQLVREKCDFLVSIPMFGHLDSLNAAVAAAVLMFEKKRQG